MPLPSNHNNGHHTTKFSIHVRDEIFTYFKRMVLPHGSQQNIGAELFEKFYQQCLAEGVSPEWDPTNGEKLAAILTRLNFSPVLEAPKPTKKKPFTRTKPNV